jgi:hypothetical protein
MVVRRLHVTLLLICVGPLLASCSGFSGVVADSVPHWAGGLPPDVPPRPGAPGYEQYIAHQNAAQAAKSAPAEPGNVQAAGAQPPPSTRTAPPAQAPQPAAAASDNQGVVRGGGLY